MSVRLTSRLLACAAAAAAQAAAPARFADDAVSLLGLDRSKLRLPTARAAEPTEAAHGGGKDFILNHGGLELAVTDQRGGEVPITVMEDMPFSFMISPLCRELRVPEADAMLLYKGERVNVYLTPHLLGLERGDVLQLVDRAPPPPPPASGAARLQRPRASEASQRRGRGGGGAPEEERRRTLRDVLREGHEEAARGRLEGKLEEMPARPAPEAGPPRPWREEDIEKSPYYVPVEQREEMDWKALREGLLGRKVFNREHLPLNEFDVAKPWIREVTQLPRGGPEERRRELERLTKSEDLSIQQEAAEQVKLQATGDPQDQMMFAMAELLAESDDADRSQEEEQQQKRAREEEEEEEKRKRAQEEEEEEEEEDEDGRVTWDEPEGEEASRKHWEAEIQKKKEEDRATAKSWQDVERARLNGTEVEAVGWLVENYEQRREEDERRVRESWEEMHAADAEKLKQLALAKEEERAKKAEKARREREEKQRRKQEERGVSGTPRL